MSEGFHVHGPHDHEVEHQAHAGDRYAGRIAVMTAVLATVGALISYQGGATQNAALLFKNEAAIKKTEASDQWAFYQAKSGKQNLAELGSSLTSGKVADDYRAEAERYKGEKESIMADARALEAASKEAESRSAESMHSHHRWAQSMALIQIAIALAAITLLTRQKWLQWMAYGAGIGSLTIAALAFVHI
jgi:hypothetical protein